MTEQQLSYLEYPPEVFLPLLGLKEFKKTDVPFKGSFLVYCVLQTLIEAEYRKIHPDFAPEPVSLRELETVTSEVTSHLVELRNAFLVDIFTQEEIGFSPELLQYADYVAMRAVVYELYPTSEIDEDDTITEIIDEVFIEEPVLSYQ